MTRARAFKRSLYAIGESIIKVAQAVKLSKIVIGAVLILCGLFLVVYPGRPVRSFAEQVGVNATGVLQVAVGFGVIYEGVRRKGNGVR